MKFAEFENVKKTLNRWSAEGYEFGDFCIELPKTEFEKLGLEGVPDFPDSFQFGPDYAGDYLLNGKEFEYFEQFTVQELDDEDIGENATFVTVFGCEDQDVLVGFVSSYAPGEEFEGFTSVEGLTSILKNLKPNALDEDDDDDED